MKAATEKKPLFAYALFGAYLAWFLVLAVKPYERMNWVAENLPIVIVVTLLAATFRRHRFSDLAYALMAVLVFLHTLGGHYSFERVPFGLITDLFGFHRNHFDRVAHFSVGFYAFPLAEISLRKGWIKSRFVLYAFPICAIFAWGALYEIIEWLYAAASNPESGAQFLGSQGDVWDAQEDMLADGLGALLVMLLFRFTRDTDTR